MVFIGLDVGTTGTKAIAVDESGRVIGRGHREYALETPRPDWVVQDAEDWWRGSIAAVRAAVAEVPRSTEYAISLSTQGATITAVDSLGNPLCPAITWMDNRSKREADELGEAIGAEAIYRKSGWPLSPVVDAAKIAWLRRNERNMFDSAAWFLSTVDFMNLRLTGNPAIDPTNAAIRQLMDIQTGNWDAEITAFVGVDEKRLPAILPSGAPVGTLTEQAAAELGLPSTTVVYSGAHDQYCAAIGSGVHETGDLLLATGTSWVALGAADRLIYTGSHFSPGHFPLTGGYGVMASLGGVGSALQWWKEITHGDYADINERAAGRMFSAASLFFYPYLTGAGVLRRPAERGSIQGLTLQHAKYDVARALMEGVAFEARLLLGEFARNGMSPKNLVMTGGAAKSDLWSEITGYVTNCEILRTEEQDASALGGAMLAAVGAGAYPGLSACTEAMVRRKPLELTDREQYEFYEDKYTRYNELYYDYLQPEQPPEEA